MATIGNTYDPATTATGLATNYTSARQSILTSQTRQASAAASALTSLRSAISSYQSSLTALTSGKTMLSQAATFSNTAVGSASAGVNATAGSYSFFVERVATANQVSYSGLADSAADGGSLGIEFGGAPGFTINLASANSDGNATLTPREIAAAINAEPTNNGRVSASIVTVNGVTQLMLTSKTTGAAGNISLNTAAVNNAGLQTALSDPLNAKQVVAGQDAIVWLGAQGTGTKIEQASNVFTNVDGVTMTFAKAQAPGDAPVTLTVASDNAATVAKVQKFVDDYNKLKGVIDAMVAPGDPAKGQAGGVFANDGGVRVLQGRMVSMLRGANGADSLAAYGIIAARDGSLSLNATRLTSQLGVSPKGLDTLIGSSVNGSGSGIAGSLDSYLKEWSSSTDGQLKQRLEQNTKLQTSLVKRQDQLDKQFDSAYKRYLMQFTQLQTLQSRMASNTSMFDALFGDKS
ncbi:flagellar filament capping protein FliD [Massilia sp. CCM 9210]|uniref:flagellar filament capping protein FliD n=1 Tax=Massilia scottii TaxID=3057166 RepID=UPI0027967B1C|nr:flagellar filament capping protein FliD [Massilia sp. CCM 9210]MDQ1816175.1 flagellar filament capping protein FliD [Massilia sp. CCM 9210]